MLLRITYEMEDMLLKRYPRTETCLKCSLCSFRNGHGCYISNYGIGVDGSKFNTLDTYTYNVFSYQQPARNPNLWLCVSCHRCHDICPYDVSPKDVIESLKAIAFESGYAPDVIQDEINNVLLTSFAFPVAQSQNVQRSKLGLSPLESAGLADLDKIARKTGLQQKLVALRNKEESKR